MKPALSVVMATRHRPHRAIAAILSLMDLAAYAERCTFYVGVDDDDMQTIGMLSGLPVNLIQGPRKSLGAITNRLMKRAPHGAPITLWSDRLHCLSPQWDEAVISAASVFPTRVLWWGQDSGSQTPVPILPPRYAKAIRRSLSPEIFPFWYDDLWHLEIDRFISGEMQAVLPIAHTGRRETTTRGREYEFWANVFAKTRHIRIQEARNIAAIMGVPCHGITPETMKRFQDSDAFHMQYAAELEARYRDTDPPDDTYLVMKQRAEELVKESICSTI